MVQDARQTARDAPEVARALVAAAKLARRRRHDTARSPASRPVALRGGDGDDAVVVPAITIYIDLDDWDARAKALGGTSNTLVAGFAAKLGERMGRRRAGDGAVTLQLPMSERTEGDTRAIAVSFARVSVDPTRVTTDLRDARAAIKQALKTLRETPDESLQLAVAGPVHAETDVETDESMRCPPTPIARCFVLTSATSARWCAALDGTDCEYAYARGTGQHVTRQWLERTGGQMMLLSWRMPAARFSSTSAPTNRAPRTQSPLCVSWLRARWLSST